MLCTLCTHGRISVRRLLLWACSVPEPMRAVCNCCDIHCKQNSYNAHRMIHDVSLCLRSTMDSLRCMSLQSLTYHVSAHVLRSYRGQDLRVISKGLFMEKNCYFNESLTTRRLSYHCQDDTIPLALLPIFHDKEGYPVINFANVNYLRSRHRVPIRGLSEMILDLGWRQCIPRHQSCRLRVPIRGHPETSGKGQNYNVESWW